MEGKITYPMVSFYLIVQTTECYIKNFIRMANKIIKTEFMMSYNGIPTQKHTLHPLDLHHHYLDEYPCFY